MFKRLSKLFKCCKQDRSSIRKPEPMPSSFYMDKTEIEKQVRPKETELNLKTLESDDQIERNANSEKKNYDSNSDSRNQSKLNDSLYSIKEEEINENEKENSEANENNEIKIEENVDVNENNQIDINLSSDKIGEIEIEKIEENIPKSEMDNIIVPDNYIREDEKDKLIWSKRGLIEFINEINNLDGYTEIKMKDDNLKLKTRKSGSVFSDRIFIAISDYTIAKKEFKEGITRDFITNLMYNVDQRKKWDDSYKDLKKLEGNDEVYIIKSIMKSPMIIISERDMVDKRIEFTHENIYYNFSTSVKSDFIPEEKGLIRCINYLNILLVEENEENYYFKSINQCDIKMPLPQSLMNITLPARLISWYKKFVIIANQEYSKQNEN